MSTLYNRKHCHNRAPYDPGARPWGTSPTGPNHEPARGRGRAARRRHKRHLRTRWQRTVRRVRNEGGLWKTVRGWVTGRP